MGEYNVIIGGGGGERGEGGREGEKMVDRGLFKYFLLLVVNKD